MDNNQKLPTLNQLFNGGIELIKKNELNVLLNQPPKAEWIKKHPLTSVDYLPIERVEYLLTAIFIDWWVRVNDIKLVGNSVVVTVTLYVIDPITGKEKYNDGIGASPLQTEKGAGAIEFNKLKSAAVMMAAPAAEAFAIKDAAEKFGKIFGKDLNRKDNLSYTGLSGRFGGSFDDDVKDKMDQITSIPELERFYDSHPQFISNPLFQSHFKKRLDELSRTDQ